MSKLAALGHPVHLAAAAEVVHIEGYSTGDNIIPSQQKNALGDINRRKFLARWETYITSRDRSAIEAIGTLVMPPNNQRCTNRSTRRALIYSPFDLTVGAGERYLLTLAAALARDYAVTIATLHPYSELRLGQLAREFCIDLSTCNIAVLDALSGDWDLMVALGNHVTPTIPARGKQSFFVCQFPFPLPPDKVPDHTMLTGYHAILAYSSYAKRYIETAIARFGMPRRPVHVLYPPVPEVPFNGQAKSPMILTVGRFVSGGHSKRHDVLIEAFRNLCSRHQGSIELHLVGSSMPDRMHMEYLANLREIAIGLPILFHVNASRRVLETLYQESAFYWHGTGLGGDLEKSPELAEHFGIAIVEAMSAGCVAFAPNAGGATEIITDNVDGCLYDTPESLVERTLVLLEDAPRRQSISTRARERIKDFTVARFVAAVQALASA